MLKNFGHTCVCYSYNKLNNYRHISRRIFSHRMRRIFYSFKRFHNIKSVTFPVTCIWECVSVRNAIISKAILIRTRTSRHLPSMFPRDILDDDIRSSFCHVERRTHIIRIALPILSRTSPRFMYYIINEVTRGACVTVARSVAYKRKIIRDTDTITEYRRRQILGWEGGRRIG